MRDVHSNGHPNTNKYADTNRDAHAYYWAE